ncbi:DUF3047 domain-containing protein [Ramlibacter sp.]|uniref:DUF3047 domain-containing protein n=1 Tax=Ramlibacter sp. TaxID=1917967 RepID=UPI003D109DD9
MNRRGALAGLAVLAMGHDGHAASAWTIPWFSSAPLGPGPVSGWQHQTLPKVERANQFEVVADGERRALRVTSSSSASTWLTRLQGELGPRPTLQWQWKVTKALPGSDLRSKQGDDYAARLYVLFDLPPDRLTLADRLRMQAARALAGVEVPAAALCYVWGSAQPAGTTGWNPYTDRVRMVVVDSGDAQAGRWRANTRDLRRDWEEAFGGPIPPVGAIAVGADTDNTRDNVEAWFGDVVVTNAS